MISRGYLAAVAALALLGPMPALANAELTQKGNLRVRFAGKLAPHALPRSAAAPVAITLGGRISTVDGSPPPQLQKIVLEINRHGRLFRKGLSVCHPREIQPSSTAEALRACGGSLVGEGSFTANVQLPQSSPFPSKGKVLAFNGRYRGRPAILAHVYGTQPIPTSYTLPFLIEPTEGTFGNILTASLPQVTGEWGFVTGISMTIRRNFTYRGTRHSYLSAGCPAAKGFRTALFRLARATFSFADGRTLASTLTRECRARG